MSDVDELEAWLLRLSGLKDLSVLSIGEMIGLKSFPEDNGLSREEWVLFSLYFIISRRRFKAVSLDSRDVMLVKSYQDLVTGIVKTLEIREDIFWLWRNI